MSPMPPPAEGELVFEKEPRACRIIATLGPASSSTEVLERLVLGGMDVARLNFSHGTWQGHRETVERLEEVSRRLARPVAVLQDLQGHKVRTGTVRGGGVVPLAAGQEVRVGFGSEISAERIGTDYPTLSERVAPGHRVYLDDARIELIVTRRLGEDLVCRVDLGGELGSRKGAIFPDSRLIFPLLNEKDVDDARFGVSLGVDMIAMSFVRSAEEIVEMRRHVAEQGWSDSCLIAKIEDQEGVEHLYEILEASDGVLVARGDLGVTLPRERVPGLQKTIIRRANARGVPVVTATQMLESMTYRDKPTRAEVNDVYTAVVDGSDAVMLSGETATGAYPEESVREMDRICREAEKELARGGVRYASPVTHRQTLRDRISASAATLAENMKVRCILSFSASGATLRALSAARPRVPVYGVVPARDVLRRLLIHRGLDLITMPVERELHSLVGPALERLRSAGVLGSGDRVVVVVREDDPQMEWNYLLEVSILK